MKPWLMFILAFALPLAALPLLLWYFASPVVDGDYGLQVAVVDLPSVIADMARHRAVAGMLSMGSADADIVDRNLQLMAEQQGLLLLAPGAVLAGAEDVTGELRLRLQHLGLLPASGNKAANALP
ncbi:MAG: hypothetical protein ACNYPG_01880 [Candidatus Porifericomitaceae bacterium WSBS_2022_MAG_OTU9]